MSIKKIVTKSEKETKEFATQFAAQILQKRGNKNAVVLALQGDLGAGKTTFTQGFAQGLGILEVVNSPTFVIMKKFQIPQGVVHKIRRPSDFVDGWFYHFDCYRLEHPEEILQLGFKEIVSNPENIVVIEWPERIQKILPQKIILIAFDHGAEHVRTLTAEHVRTLTIEQ